MRFLGKTGFCVLEECCPRADHPDLYFGLFSDSWELGDAERLSGRFHEVFIRALAPVELIDFDGFLPEFMWARDKSSPAVPLHYGRILGLSLREDGTLRLSYCGGTDLSRGLLNCPEALLYRQFMHERAVRRPMGAAT